MRYLLSQILSLLWILSLTTEVWNFETKTSRTYNSFKTLEYWNPILFLVDANFCIWLLWNKKTKYFLIVSKLLHIPPYSSIQLNDSRVMDRVFCEISQYFRCGFKRGQTCFNGWSDVGDRYRWQKVKVTDSVFVDQFNRFLSTIIP